MTREVMGQWANWQILLISIIDYYFLNTHFLKIALKVKKNNLGATGFIGKNQFPSRNRLEGCRQKKFIFLMAVPLRGRRVGGG